MSGTWNRSEALAELRAHLWRFLSPSAARAEIEAIVDGTYGVPIDLQRRIVASHMILRPETQQVLDDVRRSLRELRAHAGSQWQEQIGEAIGDVDWRRTVERRNETGERALVVSRGVLREYVSPRAQVLKTALRTIIDLAARAALGDSGTMALLVRSRAKEAHALLHHPKLGDVRVIRLQELDRVSAAMRRPDLRRVAAFLDLARRGVGELDVNLVRDLIERSVLAPADDGALFELVVGFRLVEELRRRGFTVETLHAVAGEPTPFAILTSADHRVTVWRQRSLREVGLAGFGDGAFREALASAGLTPSSLRPDFVVHFARLAFRTAGTGRSGVPAAQGVFAVQEGTGSGLQPAARIPIKERLVVVEAKLRVGETSGDRAGLADVLGYLRDYADAFRALPRPHGLVVAWGSTATPSPGALVALTGPDDLARSVDCLLAPIQ